MACIHIRSLTVRSVVVGSIAAATAALVPAGADARERSSSFTLATTIERNAASGRARASALRDLAAARAERPRGSSAPVTRSARTPDGRARATGTGDEVFIDVRSGDGFARATGRARSGTASRSARPGVSRPSVSRSTSVSRSRLVVR